MYLKTKDETKKMPGCKSGCPQSQSKDNKEVTLFLNPVDREAMSDVLSWHWRWKEIGVPAEKYSQNVDTLLPYFYQNHYKSYWFKNINKKTRFFGFIYKSVKIAPFTNSTPQFTYL